MDKEYKSPDVKGPRFRQEGYSVINRQFLKNLREKHKRCESLSDKQIRQIIKRFNETLWETVIDYRDGINLPEGLGHIFIGSCVLLSNKNIDFGKSSKYGMTVKNRNWNTDGRIAKIFYTSYSSKYKFEFRECWSFTGCRNFKRAVAKVYPENWTMYVSIDSHKKMKETYKAAVMKEIIIKRTDSKLEDYNEFDL